MRKDLIILLSLFLTQPALAQDYTVGRSGWQVERLSNYFVLLRSEILGLNPSDRPGRKGLLILTCEHQARRIRFQIGNTPRQPSTRPTELGRAIVKGEKEGRSVIVPPFHPNVRFFDDGSFELFEAAGLGEPVLRDFLHILQRVPTSLEVVLFRGTDTGRFVRGTALRFLLERLDENLVQIYGFEGLCFRSAR